MESIMEKNMALIDPARAEARKNNEQFYYPELYVECKRGHYKAKHRTSNANCCMCEPITAAMHRRKYPKLAKRRTKEYFVRRRYKLDLNVYEDMIADATHCELCNRVLDHSKDRGGHAPVMDHCHSTGDVRSVICGGCNIALGVIKDDVQTLRRMINYLEKHNQKKRAPESP